MLDVIGIEPEIHNDLPTATILSFSTIACWSKSAFRALGNPNNALDIGGCLLGMAFTIGSVQNPSNVPL
jgi:hypothetical protein